jgi:hypothetical protein
VSPTYATARFLTAQEVTVGILCTNTGRSFVGGQVARPCEFPLAARATVLQPLAGAGGFRDSTKPDSIPSVQSLGLFNYKRLEDGNDCPRTSSFGSATGFWCHERPGISAEPRRLPPPPFSRNADIQAKTTTRCRARVVSRRLG